MFGKGGSRVVHRDLEQAHLTWPRGVPQSDLSLFSLQVFTNTLAADVARLFQEGVRARAVLSIYTFLHLQRPDFSGSTPARSRRRA